MLASMQGDHDVARSLLEDGVVLRRQIDDPHGLFNALEGLANTACVQGDHGAARRYAEEMLAVSREEGDPVKISSVFNVLGSISYDLGDLDSARGYFEQAVAQLAGLVTHNAPMLSLAIVLLDQGRYDEAYAIATRALSRYRQVGHPRPQALCHATLGSIEMARGDLVAAGDHLRICVALHAELGDVAGIAEALERFVGLAVAQARFDGALRLAGAASTLRTRAGAPLLPRGQAKLDQVLAPARAALARDAADEAWQAGRALTQDEVIAAALTITEPAEPLSAPAASPSAPAGPAASTLTRREQEVAVLIARGLRNREIAEALVITEGTAASHVVHILNKLGYGSRAQVAAWAVETGLVARGASG
jgi:DNA-binding CsgD family transcriptional regulator